MSDRFKPCPHGMSSVSCTTCHQGSRISAEERKNKKEEQIQTVRTAMLDRLARQQEELDRLDEKVHRDDWDFDEPNYFKDPFTMYKEEMPKLERKWANKIAEIHRRYFSEEKK